MTETTLPKSSMRVFVPVRHVVKSQELRVTRRNGSDGFSAELTRPEVFEIGMRYGFRLLETMVERQKVEAILGQKMEGRKVL